MSEYRTFGWRHIWCAPRAAFKGATLERLTPRGEWLLSRSRLRGMDNPNVWMPPPITSMEFGVIENIRFITSESLPWTP
jgi:hypothetical protein